ncbi:hypothetical protein [Rhodococcus sp. 27YEA6]|uniref:hypothetical protein n=1 Tax=Rhodococcus sp. 27YEA6 TaxID=3156273 RepID=UPI003836FF8C
MGGQLTVSARALLSVPLVASLCLVTACSAPFWRDSVYFTPPEARVFETADCLGIEVAWGLFGVDLYSRPKHETGYLPSDFDPVAVFRCEVGEDASGALTVDMVRLEGDVAAVKDAYRVDSKRFPDNVVASCVTSELVPVKLWMANSAGQVMFPAWPSSPCGFQVGPLDSLRSLHEVERVRTSLSLSPTMANCDRSSAVQFDRTDAREVDKAREQFERGEGYDPLDNELATPVADAAGLSVCRHESQTDVDVIRLSEAESRDVVAAIADAPIAQPCDQIATATASSTLLRVDGSGGTPVSVELDGCRRAALSGYRSTPEWVTETFAR